jgi:hypothetical protein
MQGRFDPNGKGDEVTIQEFSLQLGQEQHPSQLIQALQTLRGRNTDELPATMGWAEWPEVKPAAVETPEM